MTIETIQERLCRRPFEPFRVLLSSRGSYEVRHPEMAWAIRNGLYIGLDGSGGLPERAVFCSVLHIAAVETLAAA